MHHFQRNFNYFQRNLEKHVNIIIFSNIQYVQSMPLYDARGQWRVRESFT